MEVTNVGSRLFLTSEAFRKPICPKGHDKTLVGVLADKSPKHGYKCYPCHLEAKRRHNKKVREARTTRPPNQVIGPQLETLREFFGWTKKRMAQELGVRYVTYCDWTTGNNPRTHKAMFSTVERIMPKVVELMRRRNEAVRERHERRARKEAGRRR